MVKYTQYLRKGVTTTGVISNYMEIFSILTDIMGVIFALFIYSELISLKHDNKLYKSIMYLSCVAILIFFIIATIVFDQASVISSFLCVTLPSLFIFLLLSKFKDTRFFVTHFFVAAISLILTFIARIPGIYFGTLGAISGFLITLTASVFIFIKTRPFYKTYRAILDNISDGWISNMVAMISIYLLLVFSAAYPRPLINRVEYIPIYIAICAVALTYYTVFVSSLMQKRSLYRLNQKLTSELKWHKIAFSDALTGMSNRTAYIERINEIPRTLPIDTRIFAVMIDIDGFKKVNDTFGHHAGDELLIKASNFLQKLFSNSGYEIFRIGGDEFAIIAINIERAELDEKLITLSSERRSISCAFSFGISKVDTAENNAMENAFIRADAEMYRHKNSKKAADQPICRI